MSNTEISSKVRELRELQRMADELNTEITAIQDAIKAHMTAAHTDTLIGTDYKITWTAFDSKRFDKNAMINAFGRECYEGFCKTTTTRRFLVS